MEWSPTVSILQEATELFQQAGSPSAAVQERVREGVNKLRALKDGPRYLAVILAKLTNESPETRQMAGLLLKTHISGCTELAALQGDVQSQHQMDIEVFAYCKDQVLAAIRDPHVEVRKTAGTVITTIITKYGSEKYPEALRLLMQMLGEQSEASVMSALSTIGKIVEDELTASQQDETGGIHELSVFENVSKAEIIPRLLDFAQPNVELSIKKQAIEILNIYNSHHVFAEGEFAHEFFPRFWTVLGTLAADSSQDIRLPIVSAMVTILDYNLEAIVTHSAAILTFVVACCSDPSYEVRMAALGFWSAAIKEEVTHSLIRLVLPTLLPCLTENTLYSKWDFMQMDPSQIEEDNASVPDEQHHLEPRFHQSRVAGEAGATEDDEELDKSAWGSTWTVRKAAALALDNCSRVYKGEVLPIVLPIIEVRLQHPEWQIRESGVLALGAITRGCLQDLWPYVPNVLKLLISLCDDKIPLLRSISCWCLNRFSEWFSAPANKDEFLGPVVRKLLEHFLDINKFVQEAACSAFASLEEEARELLVPFLPEIARTFAAAFPIYQTKNLFILYDAVGTLAEAVGTDLMAQPHREEVQKLVLEPLFIKWSSTKLNDYTVIAVAEAMGCVVHSTGSDVELYAPAILTKSVELLNAGLIQAAESRLPDSREDPKVDAVSCILDLLSYLVEGLGVGIQPYISQCNFVPYLERILLDPSLSVNAGVSQAIYALIGDLAKLCTPYLQPHLPVIVPKLAISLITRTWVVSSNASWAIGQLAEHAGRPAIEEHCAFIVQQLVKVITNKFVQQSLRHNACITAGRIGCVAPDILAPQLGAILTPWSQLMKDSTVVHEKEKAFRGICMALHQNPQAVVGSLCPLLECVAGFYAIGMPGSSVPPPPPSSGSVPSTSPGPQILYDVEGTGVSKEINELCRQLVAWLQQNNTNEWINAINTMPPESRRFIEVRFFSGK